MSKFQQLMKNISLSIVLTIMVTNNALLAIDIDLMITINKKEYLFTTISKKCAQASGLLRSKIDFIEQQLVHKNLEEADTATLNIDDLCSYCDVTIFSDLKSFMELIVHAYDNPPYSREELVEDIKNHLLHIYSLNKVLSLALMAEYFDINELFEACFGFMLEYILKMSSENFLPFLANLTEEQYSKNNVFIALHKLQHNFSEYIQSKKSSVFDNWNFWEKIHQFSSKKTINSVDCNEDGLVATLSTSGIVSIYNAESGSLRTTFNINRFPKLNMIHPCFKIISFVGNKLIVKLIKQMQFTQHLIHHTWDINNTETETVAWGADIELSSRCIFDKKCENGFQIKGKKIKRLANKYDKYLNFPDVITDIKLTPDDRFFVVALKNGEISIWSHEYKPKKLYTLQGYSNLTHVAVDNTDGLLATIAQKNILQIWDLACREQIATLFFNTTYINAVAVNKKTKTMITCSDHKKIIIWKLNSCENSQFNLLQTLFVMLLEKMRQERCSLDFDTMTSEYKPLLYDLFMSFTIEQQLYLRQYYEIKLPKFTNVIFEW